MRRSGDVIPIRSAAGELLALTGREQIWFMPEIEALEHDHPRRRFAAMLALVAALMQSGPGAEPYAAETARFYARFMLIPDTVFLLHARFESDAQLAERFNVPLDVIAEKRHDLYELREEVA